MAVPPNTGNDNLGSNNPMPSDPRGGFKGLPSPSHRWQNERQGSPLPPDCEDDGTGR